MVRLRIVGRGQLDLELKLTGFSSSAACAIREAYAATLTVVILVDGQGAGDDEEM